MALPLLRPLTLSNVLHRPDALSTFIDHHRLLISQGWPDTMVVGQEDVLLEIVFGDTPCQFAESSTVALWVTSLAMGFERLGLPEMLGLVALATRLIRWLILPTAENYGSIPSFLCPSRTQLTVPHAAWIDLVIWPDLRDALILRPEDCRLSGVDPISTLFAYVDVNWIHSPAHLVDTEYATTRLTLSSAFEQHIADLNNWSMEEPAAIICPLFAGKVREA